MAQEKNEPAETIERGCLRVAIWRNQSASGDVWFNVSLTRIYKDGDDWKRTTNLRRDDLPLACMVLEMAYSWIWQQKVPANPDEPQE